MKADYTPEMLARAVMAFVMTLRHTAGCSRDEIKHVLHPKMIDMVCDSDDARLPGEQPR
ncbi:hypothetical protein [Burkholderia territorii]|uniref:hypothetical protein n=1 Tax=Burkholderia territorii TaxID=1503055 RepID=UPI000ADB62B8|nr:hypothetical protein [Burkholderia territorii]